MTSVAVFAKKIITGPADRVLEHAGVLVTDDIIEAVGPVPEIEPLLGAATVRLDLPNATVLPGLIDAHVHLSFDSSDTPFNTLATRDNPTVLEMMGEHARQLLASGVTTARDLGDRDGLAATLRDQISRGEREGPAVLTAGVPLTCPGGHCGFLGGEVNDEAAITELIARNKAAGADLIKVMASGGALSPNGPPMWAAQFTRSQLQHIVRSAGEHQMAVAAHAHGTETIADCVMAGVRTLEHCSWRSETGLVYDEDVAAQIAERDIGVCRCVSGDWRLFLRQLGPNAEPLIGSIEKMRRGGVRFIAGTDAGVPGAMFGDYAGMLEFFGEIGFSAREVIDMATVNAAHALGKPDRGALTPGQRADVIAVTGDPTTDLTRLRHPSLVITGGRVHHVDGPAAHSA
jgi:imidazolonepropionase-like amidohydrolase